MDEEFSAEELAKIRSHQGEETGTSFLAKILREKGTAWASLLTTVAMKRIEFAGTEDEESLARAKEFAVDVILMLALLRPNDIDVASKELMKEVDHFLQIGIRELSKGAKDGNDAG